MRVLAFHSGGERYLVRLDAVRAVVRLRGLRQLPGSTGALAGVLDVQETSVAIYDTRPPDASRATGGDVLVLAAGWPSQAVGVACDGVEGLLELADDTDDGTADESAADKEAQAPPDDRNRSPSLPGYVEALLRTDGTMVPLVDVLGLAEATARTPLSPHAAISGQT